jgi:hypothetical protein
VEEIDLYSLSFSFPRSRSPPGYPELERNTSTRFGPDFVFLMWLSGAIALHAVLYRDVTAMAGDLRGLSARHLAQTHRQTCELQACNVCSVDNPTLGAYHATEVFKNWIHQTGPAVIAAVMMSCRENKPVLYRPCSSLCCSTPGAHTAGDPTPHVSK